MDHGEEKPSNFLISSSFIFSTNIAKVFRGEIKQRVLTVFKEKKIKGKDNRQRLDEKLTTDNTKERCEEVVKIY